MTMPAPRPQAPPFFRSLFPPQPLVCSREVRPAKEMPLAEGSDSGVLLGGQNQALTPGAVIPLDRDGVFINQKAAGGGVWEPLGKIFISLARKSRRPIWRT